MEAPVKGWEGSVTDVRTWLECVRYYLAQQLLL
jgi:hypothetical protein